MYLAAVLIPKNSDMADFRSTPAENDVRSVGGVAVYRLVLSALVLCTYLLLSRPEVILISKLGFTAWYPAVGLVFAVLLGLSPYYLPVLILADVLASLLFYHQRIFTWSVMPAAALVASIYAVAAHFLRGRISIDLNLRRLNDVVRYLAVAMTAALFATIAGVVCLAGDGTIKWHQFADSAVDWYIGDAVGLLSVAPFLLIHILPRITRTLFGTRSIRLRGVPSYISGLATLEAIGQTGSIVLLLWVMFGPLASKQYFYLAFVPIIWIAMRHGVERVVVGLLILNFGIVIALRLSPAPPEILTKVGFLMLVVSATGLIVGAAVTERRRVGAELSERTVFLNSLIENSPFAIVVQNPSGTVQLCNDAFASLYGYKRSEVIDQDLDTLIVSPELKQQAASLTAEVNAGHDVHQTLARFRKDGTSVDVETHAIPMIQDGQVQGVYIIYKDISDQTRAAKLEADHARARDHLVSELELRTDQMTLLNDMGNLLQCAASADEVFKIIGASARKLLLNSSGGALYLFKSSRNLLEFVTSWGDNGTPEKSEMVFPPPACWSLRRGQPHWSEADSDTISCTHLRDDESRNYICVPLIAQGDTLGVLKLNYAFNRASATASHGKAGDLTSQTFRESEIRLGAAAASQIALSLANLRLRESLRDQSIRDPLTGLFNRRFMQECLERELLRSTRTNRSLAVIFLDIDHFKRFNDRFGHEAGDEVLRAFGSFLLKHFRGDDVICRYGGEEFAIILPESSARDAVNRAEALRMAARHIKLTHNGETLDTVSFSAGVAGFPEHGSNASELLKVADLCLYEAKTRGRNQIIEAGTSAKTLS